MSRLMKLVGGLLVAAVFTVAVQTPSHADDATKKVRVGLVLPGPVTDGTFNSAAAKGIKSAEKKYPNISVSIRENTPMSQVQSALLDFARAGYDIVIGHGYQFAEPALKIHKQFPKTWFIVDTAKVAEAPNLASFDNRWGDAGYVAGALAALISKTGVIGHIGAIPVPVIKQYNEGFARGAKRMKPNVKVLSASRRLRLLQGLHRLYARRYAESSAALKQGNLTLEVVGTDLSALLDAVTERDELAAADGQAHDSDT